MDPMMLLEQRPHHLYLINSPKAGIFCRDKATAHGEDCEQSNLTKVRAFSLNELFVTWP